MIIYQIDKNFCRTLKMQRMYKLCSTRQNFRQTIHEKHPNIVPKQKFVIEGKNNLKKQMSKLYVKRQNSNLFLPHQNL